MLLIAAALAAAPPPIVNGEKTSDYEEVVLLYMTDRGGQYGASCTGSVIAPNWVITAAHCVTDSDGFDISQVYVIRADSFNDAGRDDYFEASKWYAHPDYNGRDGYNDIALIEVEDDLDGPYLPVADAGPKRADIGEDFRLVGYGSTSDNDTSSNPKKRMADVPLYDYDSGLLYTYDSEDNQNACYGDSGGPVMRLYEDGSYSLAGIMDFVSSCENGGLGSARVDAFMDFLDDYTDAYTVYGEEEEEEEEEEDEDDVTNTGGDGESDDDDEADASGGTLGGDDDGDLESGDISVTANCAAVPGSAGALASALAVLVVGRRRRPG